MRPKYPVGTVLQIRADNRSLYYCVYEVSRKKKIPLVVPLSKYPHDINKTDSTSLTWSRLDRVWTVFGLPVNPVQSS